MTDTFPTRFGSMNSSMNAPASNVSPAPSQGSMAPPPPGNGAKNPFNFQTQTIKDTPVVAKSVGQTSYSSSSVMQQTQVFSKPKTPIICESSPLFLGSQWLIEPALEQNIGQRRGHRYKHSSVSTQHQIFLEPPPPHRLLSPPLSPSPHSAKHGPPCQKNKQPA